MYNFYTLDFENKNKNVKEKQFDLKGSSRNISYQNILRELHNASDVSIKINSLSLC